MSGGSYEYAFSKIGDAFDNVERVIKDFADRCVGFSTDNALRAEFSAHLRMLFDRPDFWAIYRSGHWEKIIQAMHDIEWVDSCDYARGDENEAIRDCLAHFAKTFPQHVNAVKP